MAECGCLSKVVLTISAFYTSSYRSFAVWGRSGDLFSRDPWHDRHMSSRLISTVKVMCEPDLAFCARYEERQLKATWSV